MEVTSDSRNDTELAHARPPYARVGGQLIGFENRREGPLAKAQGEGKPGETPGAMAQAQEGSPIRSPQKPIAWAM